MELFHCTHSTHASISCWPRTAILPPCPGMAAHLPAELPALTPGSPFTEIAQSSCAPHRKTGFWNGLLTNWPFPCGKLFFHLGSFHWLGSPESCTSQLVSTGNANPFSHPLKCPSVAAQKSKGKCYSQSHVLGQKGIPSAFPVSPFWTVHCI